MLVLLLLVLLLLLVAAPASDTTGQPGVGVRWGVMGALVRRCQSQTRSKAIAAG